MLVRVGDIWVDPMRVEAIADGDVRDDDTRPGGYFGYPAALWQAAYTVPEQPAGPCATIWTDGGTYKTNGVTGDEAARIVNRCREARVWRKDGSANGE